MICNIICAESIDTILGYTCITILFQPFRIYPTSGGQTHNQEKHLHLFLYSYPHTLTPSHTHTFTYTTSPHSLTHPQELCTQLHQTQTNTCPPKEVTPLTLFLSHTTSYHTPGHVSPSASLTKKLWEVTARLLRDLAHDTQLQQRTTAKCSV